MNGKKTHTHNKQFGNNVYLRSKTPLTKTLKRVDDHRTTNTPPRVQPSFSVYECRRVPLVTLQKYPSDVSHTGFVSDDREGAYSLYLSSTSEVAVGGDVRCSPVKEEGEKEEEEEEVENGQGKEQDVIKKGTSKGKDQQQREHEGEQHTAQERERERGRGHLEEEGERDGETPRDRAVREWEAIDKVTKEGTFLVLLVLVLY